MTFDEFRKDFMIFLHGSKVNLGRSKTKTRDVFFEIVNAKLDAFEEQISNNKTRVDKKKKSIPNPMDDRIICIKPTNSNKALDAGKGVCAMTPSESARADEQLGRSPYTNKKGDKG